MAEKQSAKPQQQQAQAASITAGVTMSLTKLPRAFVFIGILLLAAIPPLLLHLNPVAGVYSIFFALILLFLLAYNDQASRKTAISLAVVPCALMVSVVLSPATVFEQSLLLYDTLLVLAVSYRLLFGFGGPAIARTRTWQTYWLQFPACVIVGQLLGGAGYLLLKHHNQYSGVALNVLIPGAILFAITEEVVFRGVIERSAATEFSRWWAILVPVAAYTALAALQGNLFITAFAALSSLTLSAIYAVQPDLLLTTTTNITMKLLFIGFLSFFR